MNTRRRCPPTTPPVSVRVANLLCLLLPALRQYPSQISSPTASSHPHIADSPTSPAFAYTPQASTCSRRACVSIPCRAAQGLTKSRRKAGLDRPAGGVARRRAAGVAQEERLPWIPQGHPSRLRQPRRISRPVPRRRLAGRATRDRYGHVYLRHLGQRGGRITRSRSPDSTAPARARPSWRHLLQSFSRKIPFHAPSNTWTAPSAGWSPIALPAVPPPAPPHHRVLPRRALTCSPCARARRLSLVRSSPRKAAKVGFYGPEQEGAQRRAPGTRKEGIQ